MGLNLIYGDGQTLLDEDEREGLLISTITNRAELDEFEQLNIEDAILWSIAKRWTIHALLTEEMICSIHQQMFGRVWSWAGTFRRSNKNIGSDYWQIGIHLKQLLDDVVFWYEHKTYGADEITLRCKQRLVSIHCFANGNGRHSRLFADLLAEKIFKLPVYTWGVHLKLGKEQIRQSYLSALREADKGNYEPLVEFARS
jgi:Fic-DOC domain mobile mystery protein B